MSLSVLEFSLFRSTVKLVSIVPVSGSMSDQAKSYNYHRKSNYKYKYNIYIIKIYNIKYNSHARQEVLWKLIVHKIKTLFKSALV